MKIFDSFCLLFLLFPFFFFLHSPGPLSKLYVYEDDSRTQKLKIICQHSKNRFFKTRPQAHQTEMAVWPNGKALDYELKDSGFNPQHGHLGRHSHKPSFFFFPFLSVLLGGPPSLS